MTLARRDARQRLAGILLASTALAWVAVAIFSEFSRNQVYGYNVSAALHPGERLHVHGLTVAQRLRLNYGSPRGMKIIVPVETHHGKRLQQITTTRTGVHVPDPVVYLGTVAALLLMAFVVGKRPSAATAFLLWFVMSLMYPDAIVNALSPLPDGMFVTLAAIALVIIGSPAAVTPLAFVVRFPSVGSDRTSIAAVKIANAVLVFTAVVFVLGTVVFAGVPTHRFFSTWLPAIGMFLGLAAAVWRYTTADDDTRHRLAWVLFGISIANVSTAVILFGTADSGEVAKPWYAQGAEIASLLLPVTLAYAILKQHVLDLRFVVNRTVVFAAIAAILVVAISFVDWFVGRIVADSHTALAIEAAVAIAFGVLLRRLHATVEKLVDRVVFRSRYLAAARLERQIDALDYAESESTIDDTLTLAAARTMSLASAAVFRRDHDEREFTCRSAFGWRQLTGIVGSDGFVVRAMRSGSALAGLPDENIDVPGAPAGDARPYIAIPISTRQELRGFVFYGRHADGTTPDPTERALLVRLAHAAAASYESVNAQRYREIALRFQRSAKPNQAFD
jgi:hypothetical protein